MKTNSVIFAGALLFLPSPIHAGEPSQPAEIRTPTDVGQAFQPAGARGFPAPRAHSGGWEAALIGRPENLPHDLDSHQENCSEAALPVQSVTLDVPTPPKPPGTNSAVALELDDETLPMFRDLPVSRLGPKNLWRLLYEEGDLETIRDPMSHAGADIYHGDLYRFESMGKDCSVGLRVESKFTDSNSEAGAPNYHAGLFFRIHTK